MPGFGAGEAARTTPRTAIVFAAAGTYIPASRFSPSSIGINFQSPLASSREANSQITSFLPTRRSFPRCSSLASISRVAKLPASLRVMASTGRPSARLRCSASPAPSPQPMGASEKILVKLSPRSSISAFGSGCQGCLPSSTCRTVAVSGVKTCHSAGNLSIIATSPRFVTSLAAAVKRSVAGDSATVLRANSERAFAANSMPPGVQCVSVFRYWGVPPDLAWTRSGAGSKQATFRSASFSTKAENDGFWTASFQPS